MHYVLSEMRSMMRSLKRCALKAGICHANTIATHAIAHAQPADRVNTHSMANHTNQKTEAFGALHVHVAASRPLVTA